MKRCNEQVLFSTAVEVAWGDESTIHHCELVEFEEYSQILKEWNKREAWKVDGKYSDRVGWQSDFFPGHAAFKTAQVDDWVISIEPIWGTGDVSMTPMTIERTTKTQITVDGTRFLRSTGARFGDGDSWNITRSILPFDTRYLAVVEAKKRCKEIELNQWREEAISGIVGVLETASESQIKRVMRELGVE